MVPDAKPFPSARTSKTCRPTEQVDAVADDKPCPALSPILWHERPCLAGQIQGFIVQDNDHLLIVARYIEANPVRAGLTEAGMHWVWSSHVARCTVAGGIHPDTLPIPLPDDWTNYVDTPLTDAEIEKLRNSVNRQTPFGKEDWKNEMCGKMVLESTVRPRGWQKGRKRGVNNQPVPL